MTISITKTFEFWAAIPIIGRWIFSWLILFVSPYTASIPIRVQEITEDGCKTTLLDSFFTKNPFKSVHAAALTNLGEATMGLAILGWCEQRMLRSIPTSLTVDFHSKAKGELKAVCKLPDLIINSQDATNTIVLVTEIYDKKSELVCTVKGKWKISRIASAAKKLN